MKSVQQPQKPSIRKNCVMQNAPKLDYSNNSTYVKSGQSRVVCIFEFQATFEMGVEIKSDNLQYNMVGQWFDGSVTLT